MDLINKLVFPPSTEHLVIAKYLLVLTLFVHLSYMGFVVGCSIFSLFFSIVDYDAPHDSFRRFSRYLIDLVTINRGITLFLGVLPLLAASILYSEVLYRTPQLTAFAAAVSLPLVIVGLILLYAYKSAFRLRERNFIAHLAPGIIGLGALMIACLILLSGVSLSMDPEKWPFINNPYNFFMFSWNNLARFGHFMVASFAITGGGILFFHFNWPEGDRGDEPRYTTFVRNFGAGLTLGSCVVLPILVLWNLITLPNVAISLSLYAAYLIAVILLAHVSHKLYLVLSSPESRPGARIFITLLAVFLVLDIANYLARENAISDHTGLLVAAAEAARMEMEAKREAAAPVTASVGEGEQVYKTVCATCHRFDVKVVGPPYNQTLPKYVGHQDQLEAFVRQPTPKNPGYPPMPQLGLRPSQIKSVAMYLLQTYQSEAAKKK